MSKDAGGVPDGAGEPTGGREPDAPGDGPAATPGAPGAPTRKPSLRARLRPVELVGISAIIAVFVGLVVGMGTREPLVALEFGGVAFVVVLVVTAMLLLAATPRDERPDADRDRHGSSH